MDEIIGPWQPNQLYFGHVSLYASANMPPIDFQTPGSFSGFAVYSSFSIAGGWLYNASKVGALGDLEVAGANVGGYNCTSCSPTGDIIWYSDPSVLKHSISWGTGSFTLGNVSNLEAHLFLDLPEGFSLASQQVSAVPEPSTWAMLLIGAAGLWLRLRAPMARCTSVAGARNDQTDIR
jgi:hypothetical protein